VCSCVNLLLVLPNHHLDSSFLLSACVPLSVCLVSAATQVCLLNYRKDGSTFLNQFFLSPIKVGVQQQQQKQQPGVTLHSVCVQQQAAAEVAARCYTAHVCSAGSSSDNKRPGARRFVLR
jgi:hypothetical protein